MNKKICSQKNSINNQLLQYFKENPIENSSFESKTGDEKPARCLTKNPSGWILPTNVLDFTKEKGKQINKRKAVHSLELQL